MKGKSRVSLGDLFDVLLPMLNIYQEYVRNHHFSLQILTECKQNPNFSSVLARLEEHSACKGRSLETFLTYPMHQVCQRDPLVRHTRPPFNCPSVPFFSVPTSSVPCPLHESNDSFQAVNVGFLPRLDPALHHHAARDPGAHAARARGETQPGERARPAGAAVASDARRGTPVDGSSPDRESISVTSCVGARQVSETENIRKCLAIERMIVEGCDILMDVTQVFVRQGAWALVPSIFLMKTQCTVVCFVL